MVCLQMFDPSECESEFGSGSFSIGSLGQSLYSTLHRQEVRPDSCVVRDWTCAQANSRQERSAGIPDERTRPRECPQECCEENDWL